MIKPITLTVAIRSGNLALIYDPRDNDWSLWNFTDPALLLVGWHGKVEMPPTLIDGEWGPMWKDRAKCYVLTQLQADQCVMAAVAFTQREDWWAFARRLVS